MTQDGPSYVYTAMVAHDVVFDSSSAYAATYQLNGPLTPGWTMPALMDAIVSVVGPAHAEQALSTICVLAGFFAFSYLLRSFDPSGSPWSPVVNFLLNTWFLWIGFYSFYLGMLLCAFVVGFYIRHAAAISWKMAAVLSALFFLLYYTHLLPFCLAVVAIASIAFWMQATAPSVTRLIRTGIALIPGLLILGVFLAGAQRGKYVPPKALEALRLFPMHVFASSVGRIPQEKFLYPVIGLFALAGILSMKKQEWSSPRGAVVLLTLFSFAFYLYVPDAGFGGSVVKIRFAWAVFVFGSLVALSASRTGFLRLPVAVYTAALLAASLTSAMLHNVQNVSSAIEEASVVMDRIPADARVIRIRYASPVTRARFDFEKILVDPLLHVDAWFASRNGWVDLTDYQSLSLLFPVVVQPEIARLRFAFWALEGGTETGSRELRELLKQRNLRMDYIVVTGDTTDSDRVEVLAELKRTMQFVASGPDPSFIWIFRRRL